MQLQVGRWEVDATGPWPWWSRLPPSVGRCAALRTAYCVLRSRTASMSAPAASHTAYCVLRTAYCVLHAGHGRLTAYCAPRTAYCIAALGVPCPARPALRTAYCVAAYCTAARGGQAATIRANGRRGPCAFRTQGYAIAEHCYALAEAYAKELTVLRDSFFLLVVA